MTPILVGDLLRRTILMVTPTTDVIFYWANAPRPSTDYASITINTIKNVGHGEEIDIDDVGGDINRSHAELFDINFGVDFYRNGASFSATLLSMGLIRNEVVELWNSEDIGLVERSEVLDITALFGSEFEDRARIKITMQAMIQPPDEIVLGVDAFRINGEVFNHSGKFEDVAIGPIIIP